MGNLFPLIFLTYNISQKSIQLLQAQGDAFPSPIPRIIILSIASSSSRHSAFSFRRICHQRYSHSASAPQLHPPTYFSSHLHTLALFFEIGGMVNDGTVSPPQNIPPRPHPHLSSTFPAQFIRAPSFLPRVTRRRRRLTTQSLWIVTR